MTTCWRPSCYGPTRCRRMRAAHSWLQCNRGGLRIAPASAPPKPMEIYQLRTFSTVARCGNITRAASQLCLTQSTISGQIKALEAELGICLFVRRAGGVEITPLGERLLSKAQALLAIADELLSEAHAHAGRIGGHLQLATINDAETLGLGKFMTRMRDHCPDVTVLMRHGLSGWALSEVKNGQCDAGFFIGPVTDPEVRALPIREIRYCIAAPIGWRAQVEAEGWAAMGRLPWLWVPALGSYPGLVTALLAKHGVTPVKVVETDREATTLALVSAGVGLCLLSEERARPAALEGKIYLWDEGRTQADLSLIYLASREKDPLIQALVSVIAGDPEVASPR
ncbi:MAG: LysR family transcriptional regulator [Variovorax sp.]|nr:MAG: LysR family transcriptional regulator [Variovorax sp.]